MSFFVMEYVPPPYTNEKDPEYERRPMYMDIPPFLLYDRVDALITANEQISDWMISDFIIASGG